MGQTSANSIAVTPNGLLGAPDPRTRGAGSGGRIERSRCSSPDRVRPAFFQRALIGRPRVNAIEKRHRLGMTLLETGARGGGFQRKAHLDIGGGEVIAGEPFALRQFAFPERHVLLELRIDQRRQRLIGNLAHQRAQQAPARASASA